MASYCNKVEILLLESISHIFFKFSKSCLCLTVIQLSETDLDI